MMTPQEVSEHAFAKASFGGYNMAMVDEFLDQVTGDYTALYKETASLKVKMKVLVDSLEEYRATEKGMRRALLAAQQAADEMVKEAEGHKFELVKQAEAEARVRMDALSRQVTDEEARLASAQSATASYVEKVGELTRVQTELMARLEGITAPPPTTRAPDAVAQTAQAIEESVQRLVEEPAEAEAPAETAPIDLLEERAYRSRRDEERARGFDEEPDAAQETSDEEDEAPTRRIDFDNLQFGANYDLK